MDSLHIHADMSFLSLGATAGVSRVFLPSVDDGYSQAINIPGGFPYGSSNHTTVFVSMQVVVDQA